MLNSLEKLSCLPANTQLYCTHEYTLKNIEFALTLDATNQDLIEYKTHTQMLRNLNQPSLPSSIKIELSINPFLRCSQKNIQQAVLIENGDTLATFSAIRMLRNNY